MSPEPDVERGFAEIGGRELHVRRHGDGPPVLLLSDAPRSSRSLLGMVRRLGRDRTVLAPDLPGSGRSEALPAGADGIEAHADAVAGLLAALDVGPLPVFGTGTGAQVALELARRHGDRVLRLVLEELPTPAPEEREALLRHGAPERPPVPSGAHLLDLWTQVRDGYLFSPWFAVERERRVRRDVPPPAVLHDTVMDMLLADAAPAALLRARVEHDALAALQAVEAAGIAVDRVPADGDHEQVARLLSDDAAGANGNGAGAWPPSSSPRAGRLTRRYCATSAGRLLVRQSGGDGIPLVLLHGSPGSALSHLPLVEAVAAGRPVLAFDTLGNGDSDKPDWEHGAIATYAGLVGEALDGLDVDRCDVYGTHTGADIGLELAIARPDLVRGLVLDGVGIYEEAERRAHVRHYTTTDLTPRPDGTHLVSAWHMMRNATLFWPWYRADAAHVRDVDPFDLERLNGIVLDLLRSGPTFRLAYEAAFWHQTSDRIGLAEVPMLLLTAADDVLHDSTVALADRLPTAQVVDLPDAEPATTAAAIERFTAGLR